MKKTLTINLSGIVYHIDEDAYVLLDNYLKNLRSHFRREVGVDEIMCDIETRISELFNGFINDGIQIITVKQVEAVITCMGKTEDLFAEEENESEKKHTETDTNTWKAQRKLFRNPDDRILGGVVSGVAAYFGWEPVLLRLLFLIAGLFVQGLLIVYLIAWIIIPLARTATEKLQMHGKAINVENIGRTVTDGFEQTGENVYSDKPRSVFLRLCDTIVRIAGFIIKLFLVVLGILLLLSLLVALFITVVFLFAAMGWLASVPVDIYQTLPAFDWNVLNKIPVYWVVGMFVCGLFAAGIPIMGLLQLIFQHFKIWRPMSRSVTVALVLLWILSVVVGLVFCTQLYYYL